MNRIYNIFLVFCFTTINISAKDSYLPIYEFKNYDFIAVTDITIQDTIYPDLIGLPLIIDCSIIIDTIFKNVNGKLRNGKYRLNGEMPILKSGKYFICGYHDNDTSLWIIDYCLTSDFCRYNNLLKTIDNYLELDGYQLFCQSDILIEGKMDKGSFAGTWFYSRDMSEQEIKKVQYNLSEIKLYTKNDINEANLFITLNEPFIKYLYEEKNVGVYEGNSLDSLKSFITKSDLWTNQDIDYLFQKLDYNEEFILNKNSKADKPANNYITVPKRYLFLFSGCIAILLIICIIQGIWIRERLKFGKLKDTNHSV